MLPAAQTLSRRRAEARGSVQAAGCSSSPVAPRSRRALCASSFRRFRSFPLRPPTMAAPAAAAAAGVSAAPASAGGAPADAAHPRLKNFFVFNPSLSKREETEHLKLLYFWPPDTPMDNKMNLIGLSEALTKYTSTFSKQPCEALHTLKTRQVFLNPEPNFWLSMTVNLPYTQRTTKEGQTVFEYHEEDVQDTVLQAQLKQAYNMYKLFNGSMAGTLERYSSAALMQKLEMFFPQFLRTVDVASIDLLDTFEGIRFLPLDKTSYLRIQCFINLVESTFPTVQYSVFLYNDHLVWSGLEQDDMRILFKYLTGGLLKMPAGSAGSADFVTGPETLTDPDAPVNAPQLHVTSPRGEPRELMLIIYQCGNIKVCFFIEPASLMDLEFYKKLHAFVKPQLEGLDKMIAQQQARRVPQVTSDIHYKYLYFNYMNLAQKCTFSTGHAKKNMHVPAGAPLVMPDIVRHLADIHSDFDPEQEDSEVVVKTASDCWVVGRKSEQREFFVILNQKNANLIEIQEEVRRLCATHFNNIFLVD